MTCNKIRKPLSLVFAFIVTFLSVSCQILPCIVFASSVPVGQPVTVEGLGWKIIEGTGPEPNLVRDPYLMTVESMTTFGLGTLAAQSFWEETNAEIAQKIQDGTLSNTDVGSVIYKEVDGQQVPVAIKNTIYGQNMYFITDDLAEQIRQQNLQTDAAISAACMDYWERVIVSDIEPFQQAAEAAENWVTSFPDLAVQTESLISEIMFDLFGVQQELDPASTFQDTGIWISYKTNQAATRYTERKVNTAGLDAYDSKSFTILTWDAQDPVGRPAKVYALYGHLTTESDPFKYNKLDALYFSTSSFYELKLNGIPVKEIAFGNISSDSNSLNSPNVADFSNVFESWPEIVALPNAQPLILPNVHYNVGNITGAVNAICAAADAAIAAQTSPGGSPEFTPETRPEIAPAELPELLPVPYEVPWPTSFPAEFPDPDPWLDPDSNPWPDPAPKPNPDPGTDPEPDVDPDPAPDPDAGGGYNNDDWNKRPPDRPKLKIPVLFGLFPFCIPFDIKKSIEWFGYAGSSEEVNGSLSASYNTGVYNNMSDNEVEEINGSSGDPVFAIPLNLGIAGQPFLQTVLVIDLTEYGIPTLVYYLKAVQIVLWVIALAWATKNVIY